MNTTLSLLPFRAHWNIGGKQAIALFKGLFIEE